MKYIISPNGYYYKEYKNSKKVKVSKKTFNKYNKNILQKGGVVGYYQVTTPDNKIFWFKQKIIDDLAITLNKLDSELLKYTNAYGQKYNVETPDGSEKHFGKNKITIFANILSKNIENINSLLEQPILSLTVKTEMVNYIFKGDKGDEIRQSEHPNLLPIIRYCKTWFEPTYNYDDPNTYPPMIKYIHGHYPPYNKHLTKLEVLLIKNTDEMSEYTFTHENINNYYYYVFYTQAYSENEQRNKLNSMGVDEEDRIISEKASGTAGCSINDFLKIFKNILPPLDTESLEKIKFLNGVIQ